MYLRLSEYRMSNKESRRKKAKSHSLQRPHFVIRHSSFVIPRRGLTLIEMLIGMAITLVMMAAVVTLFANIGSGIRVQRAAMEMSSQLRTARARLFKDLAGATCAPRPKLPTDDHDDGYIEIIEGQWSDKNPSALLDGNPSNGELDYTISQVPSSNLNLPPGNVTDGGALGDYDDILALTVRSESEPFVGRHVNASGNVQTVKSNLAEVVWYAIENPADGSLGEPGMRTVYRRVLLIAPWLDLPSVSFEPNNFFQNFDISAHYDTTINAWIPNTLSDLTKRENRYSRTDSPAIFPHPLDSGGSGFSASTTMNAVVQRGTTDTLNANATVNGNTDAFGIVTDYTVSVGGEYDVMPTIMPPAGGVTNPTPRPVMAKIGGSTSIWKVAHVTNGPAPLAFDRQGEDVMLNDALAFDVRVYEPGAPLVATATGTPLEPSDFGWYEPGVVANILGYGSYVDLGWAPAYPPAALAANVQTVTFQVPRQVGWHPNFPALLTEYPAVYDTWSFHYENDGLDQDGDGVDSNGDGVLNNLDAGVDEGTNALDDNNVNGVNDIGEHETSPPYNVPLRGIQVKLRVYEPDTRQIREATVTRGFVPQ